MKIYNYSAATGEYIGEEIADASPLEPGVWLIPANATVAKPPSLGLNQVAVFKNGNWTVDHDFRGTTYYTVEGNPVVIEHIGAVDSNLFAVAPTVFTLNGRFNLEHAQTNFVKFLRSRRNDVLYDLDLQINAAVDESNAVLEKTLRERRVALRNLPSDPKWLRCFAVAEFVAAWPVELLGECPKEWRNS